MSILIDDREDDSIRRALAGHDLDISICRLEYGDGCWEGRGPRGPLMCGVERKHLPDLINGMTDRRLTGFQLAGMSRLYDVLYLVIEDYWRPTENGGIEIMRGRKWTPLRTHNSGVSFRQLDSYLSSLSSLAGVTVLRSGSTAETAAMYSSRYHWWQKPWNAHHSTDLIWTRPPHALPGSTRAAFSFREPGLVERTASLIPGVDRLAWDVGRRFKSIADMAGATVGDWKSIPGFGNGRAHTAWCAMHGLKDGSK